MGGRVTVEKESLSVMLSKEMAAREMHQQERAGLVSRLEDVNAIMGETAKSKDLAVEKLRSHIEQNDQFRKQVAKSNEEISNTHAELSEVRKELETTQYDLEVVNNHWIEAKTELE